MPPPVFSETNSVAKRNLWPQPWPFCNHLLVVPALFSWCSIVQAFGSRARPRRHDFRRERVDGDGAAGHRRIVEHAALAAACDPTGPAPDGGRWESINRIEEDETQRSGRRGLEADDQRIARRGTHAHGLERPSLG